MAGFIHTPNDTIEDLRRNLRDRYKDCHAVLKELLQNADDAGATELHIVWVEAFQEARHSLLKGPMLLIVNNGPFTYRDSYSIHLAGAGSKGHDESKIGKFGLGLKSVFHLCEAFFYVSDSRGDDETVPEQLKQFGRTGVLNPWSGARYSAWDTFELSDQRLLRDLVPVLLGRDAVLWFAICLPLRKQEHCRENASDDPADWAIEARYYGDASIGPPDDVFSEVRVASIRHMLPLMSSLEIVRFSRVSAARGSPPVTFAEVRRSALGHVKWRELPVGQARLSGSVDVACSGRAQKHTYAGVQELLRNETLANLPAQSTWPRMDAQTDTGRKRAPAAVKQHAAVVIVEQPGSGALRVDRAVFLPLGDPPHPECQSVGTHDFDLILHGYFFVDAGRRGVDFAPEHEQATLRQQWNAILYRDGTLPLIILALHEYGSTIAGQPNADARLQLITGLLKHHDCQLWRDHQEEMCRDSSWCFRLSQGRGEWCAVDRRLPLLLLPGGAETDPALPFKVFPSLQGLAEGVAVSFAGLPRLSVSTCETWPDDFVEALLQSVPLVTVIDDEASFAYMRRVCEEVSRQASDRYIPFLVKLLRRLFREVSLSNLREHASEIAALVSLLPPATLITVPFKPDLVRESERLLDCLASQQTDALPVSDLFVSDQVRSRANLNTLDARVLLTALSSFQPAGAQEDAFHSLVGQAISTILAAWRPGQSSLLAEFGDLRIFYARNHSTGRRSALSPHELKDALAARRLFAINPSLCPKLQSALDNTDVLYLLADKPLASQLAPALGVLPGCDASACASLLATRPALKEAAAARVRLLDELLRAWPDNAAPTYRQAMRYLLHRYPDDQDASALFIDNHDAWSALAQCLLSNTRETWRLIPKPLLENVTIAQLGRLNLTACTPPAVVALVNDANLDAIDCTTLTANDDWRDTIIREWPESEKHRITDLPIFRRSDGSFVRITPHTFVRGDLPLPPAEVFPDLELIDDPSGVIVERRLARTLAPADLVGTALDDKACHRHWRFILETFPNELSDDLRQKLRQSRWLPDRDANGNAPAAVIARDGLCQYVRALQKAGRMIIHADDLSPDVLLHPRWKVINELCPRSEELYRVLGEALTAMPNFAVGDSAVQETSLSTFIALFAEDKGDAVMPTAHLFYVLRASDGGGTQWIAKHLLPAVRGRLDAEHSTSVLYYLADRHVKAPGAVKHEILSAFNRYLAEAATHGLLPEILPRLRLLNQQNQWTDPSRLTVRGENVAPENLLAREHANALVDYFKMAANDSASRPNVIIDRQCDEKALRRSADVLGGFLDTWRSDDVPDDAIAAVVAVLGDNDAYPALYERLRDTRALTAMRGLFSWHTTGPGWSVRDLMTKQHFCIVPADANTVSTTNLLGETFDASVSARLECLFDGFDGRTYFPLPNDERCYLIRLRQIDPSTLSGGEKLAILGRSVLLIRSLIHRQTDEDFQAIWNQITHVGQLDIEIAQEMILESSAMLLETQLSVRASPQLRKLFNDWHQVRQRAKTATLDSDRKAADDDRRQVLESLRTLLRDDKATQSLLVGEICKRLDAVSYSAKSIPFEIFQNGDDAVVELEALCKDKDVLDKVRLPELRHKFVVDTRVGGDVPVVRFFHWGRGINQFRIGASDGKNDGFDRDMERMLVLRGSGKDDDAPGERRTGKFGLGFKSVFFVCDSPRVLSGVRSRFRVVAGVYPDQLPEVEERRLQQALEQEGDQFHRGTVVELPLRHADNAKAALQDFRHLAGYLVVFARRIRRCCVNDAEGASLQYEWSPQSVLPGIEAGTVRGSEQHSQDVLVFRLGMEGYAAMLVPLSAHGICDQALKEVPEVWVTTPTKEPAIGRLMVNGCFDLNPGRTQLRETENNSQLAREMGLVLGDQLCRLRELAAQEWPTLREALGCRAATADQFWASLWRACAPYAVDHSGNGVLRQVLFGSEHCGVHRLIRETDALPSDLPDEYECLTRLGSIRWRLSGVLADLEVWADVTHCAWMQEHVLPGTVVSPTIFKVLEGICHLDVQTLSIKTIVEGTFHDGYVAETSTAHDLGQLLPPQRLRRMKDDKRSAPEEEAIRELLSGVKFRTVGGDWCDAVKLLIRHGDEPDRREERRRAAFAPGNRIIDSTYVGPALEFFLSCRGDMNAPARELATWILRAKDVEARKAALEYLEQGEQSFRVEQELKELKSTCANCWLDNESELAAAMPPDTNRQAVVMGKLQKGAEFAQRQNAMANQPPAAIASRAPGAVFRDILGWWRRNQYEILSHHNAMIYPDGKPPQLKWTASQQQLATDVDVRRNWLILFMLGSMHRIGRATQHQHRGFLDLCIERGWLDALAKSPNDPSKWFNIMEDYLDSLQGDATYYHWMAQFLTYYQMARWLPRYARAFEAVTRPGVNLGDLRSIRDISDLRRSHIFAGSTGFDAPPCSRTLGLGAHFVLREAARLRIAQTDGHKADARLAPLAFVPGLRTRRFVAQALGRGDDSDKQAATQLLDAKTSREEAARTIEKVLRKHLGDEATFDGSFDIPLLVLTWPKYESVCAGFFGHELTGPKGGSFDFLDEAGAREEEPE